MVKISLIASSVRCWLWDEFMNSLSGNEEFEVVFVGNLTTFQVRPYLNKYINLKYIHTSENIPPAQCYEIARRNSLGELIMWVADDCEFSEKLLDNVFEYWHKTSSNKIILSVKTNENSTNNCLDDHRFFGFNVNTPLMAPLGVMSREYLNTIGGFDSRYCCGQYENDVAMRVYADGGEVLKYEDGCVFIEHIKKHGSGTKFWSGYSYDRKVLEDTWVRGGHSESNKPMLVLPVGDIVPYHYYPIDNRMVLKQPNIKFHPYEYKDLLTVSQCPIKWPIE